MSAVLSVQSGHADPKSAADSGMEARGSALARTFLAEVRHQSGILARYLAEIAALDQTGRRQFRVDITAHLNQMREHVKANPDNPVFQKAFNSAQVRISEARTFSKAIDAGMEFDASQPYHALIAAARLTLESSSATGPTQRRGRPAKPLLDKFKAWLEKNASPEDLSQLKEFLEAYNAVNQGN